MTTNTTANNNVNAINNATMTAPTTEAPTTEAPTTEAPTANAVNNNEPRILTIYDGPRRHFPENNPGYVILTYSTISDTKGEIFHTALLPHRGSLGAMNVAKTLVKFLMASYKVKQETTFTFTDENGMPIKHIKEKSNGEKVEEVFTINGQDILARYLRAEMAEISDGSQTFVLRGDEGETLKTTILGKAARMWEIYNAAQNKNAKKEVLNQLSAHVLSGLNRLRRMIEITNAM